MRCGGHWSKDVFESEMRQNDKLRGGVIKEVG